MSSQAATEDKGEIIEEEEKKELAPVSLAILHKIKTQQLQNGLRHGDYECYRKFCTLRARRIRKKLQFKHRAPKGTKVKRGEYFKRDIAEEEIDDARYVELFLVYAERAWALAMEKKSDDMPRSKFYSLRRLRKAAKWAKQLKELCERSAEEKTKLEAQSYAAWLQGLVFVEEENWKEALQQFHGAKTVYEQLSKVGSKEHKTLCLERADEIEPNIRFCVYNLKDEHQDESQIIDMLEQSEGNTLLMEKLSGVVSETRLKKADATHAIEQISWRGSVIPIKNEKLRLALITAEELGKQTESGDGDIAEQIALYDKLSFQYSNAEDCVSKDPTISDLDKTCLRNYIAYLRTKKRIERTLMLATKKQASVDKQDLGPYPRKFHGDKADDLVRLYEILVQYVAQTGADEDDDKNQRVAAHQTFKAHRAFYMAVVFAKSRKYAESVVLFQYANTLLSKALQTHNSEAKPDTRLVSKINHLQQLGEQHLCEARARRLLGNSNEQSDSNYSSAALLENLNVYDASFLEKKTLMHFPPKQNVMGCKPIQFDIASNDCKFPDLEDRTKTKAKQGGWLSYFMGS